MKSCVRRLMVTSGMLCLGMLWSATHSLVHGANPAEVGIWQQILSPEMNVDRAAAIAKLGDSALRAKVTAALPEIEQAAQLTRRLRQLAIDVEAVHGKIESSPGGAEWLRAAAGDEAMKLFDAPTKISLWDGNNPLKGQGKLNTVVNDAWLKRLAGLISLTMLDLSNCDIHRAGLEHVATLKQLQTLNLTLSAVVDDDLAPLAALTDLKSLSLASTHTTGEGFRHLTSLRQLSNLNMHHALTNDAGLAAIAKVGNLERLWMAHTHFTDAAAEHLSAHKNLRRLGIGSTEKREKEKLSSGRVLTGIVGLPLAELELFDDQATNEGVLLAARVKSLKMLHISYGPTVDDSSLSALTQLAELVELKAAGTKLTDAGLLKLAGMKSLQKITLSKSPTITEAGLSAARGLRSDLTIEVK